MPGVPVRDTLYLARPKCLFVCARPEDGASPSNVFVRIKLKRHQDWGCNYDGTQRYSAANPKRLDELPCTNFQT